MKAAFFKKFFRIASIPGHIGFRGAASYFLIKLLNNILLEFLKSRQKFKTSIHSKGFLYPIYLRLGTSDINGFDQIFVEKHYACLTPPEKVNLIIDCGANIGLSSIYFLNKYPCSHVISVEPDPDNFLVCQQNLSPYGSRVTLLNLGVWSHVTDLKICRGKEEYAKAMSFQVRPCKLNEFADVRAIGIGDILEQSRFKSIDILKIDIEGSESSVFSDNYQSWLSKVKNLVIELHGQDCEAAFLEAMKKFNYRYSTQGELTICEQMDLAIEI